MILTEVIPATTLLDGATLAPYSSTNAMPLIDNNTSQIIAGSGGASISIPEFNDGISQAILVHPARVNAVGNHSQLSLAAGSHVVIAYAASVHGWIIQNISANPMYITFGAGNAITSSATSGAFKLSAGKFITSFQLFGGVWQGTISACPTNANDMMNIFYA